MTRCATRRSGAASTMITTQTREKTAPLPRCHLRGEARRGVCQQTAEGGGVLGQFADDGKPENRAQQARRARKRLPGENVAARGCRCG